MIISKTPFRVSFFGGGTDYPAWFRENGGSVLAASIDKYCYISLRHLPPFFDHKHRIVYSSIELVNDPSEVKHPVVRALLSQMDSTLGYEIHHAGDLPARSGLGSSSAFTVGLLHALQAQEGRMMSVQKLAGEAIRIEQEVLRENVGCQDQISVAHGGFNRIDFHRDGSFAVRPVILPARRRQELEQSTMLFFTGFSRFASVVAKKQIDNFPNRRTELTAMGQMVDEALSILQSPTASIDEFGRLLHESWKLKRGLAAEVSSPEIDAIYEAGMAAGASGGKLLGAGGGGFVMFIVRPDLRDAVRARLKNLIHVGIGFETGGSRIVVYEPPGLEDYEDRPLSPISTA
ncbi:MAG: kinase [Alphaproteobacteria bacterium]|nr:kinase [Alphaproteobacteria bacterium]MBF0129011.1 kinase [Alphaproteobacteria bacterium]